MYDDDSPFTEPIAPTSRAILTLPHKPRSEESRRDSPSVDPERIKLYDQAWSICHARIQTTLASLHDQSLDQIVTFVKTLPSDSDPLALYTALTGGKVPLKTGLILGASPGSSSLVFTSLLRQLRLAPAGQSIDTRVDKPCLVSRLTSRECSNIKNALKSLIAGFVGSDVELELDDDDDDDTDLRMAAQQQRYSALKSSLMVPEDMQNLVAWYESKHGKRGTDQAPSLVVLIEDLEAFDGRTLTQLVTTLSKYTTQLPLVLLVGVATIPDALYNLVPRHTTNLLDVSHFFVDPGIGAFNALVRGLFIDFQPPLSIGPKAFSDMYRSFEDLHHSIDSTISYIQYLYMNYYLSSPFAPLNLSTSYRKSEHLSQESQEVLSTVSSLESQPQTIETLEGLESELESIRGERQEAFETLLIMLEFWDKKRSVENCLYLVLGAQQEGTVGGGINKLIQDLCGLVLQASSTKLLLFLKSLSERLGAYSAQHPASATTISRSLLAQLEDLETCLSKPRPNGRTNLINVNLASSTSGGGLPGFADLTGTSGGSGVSQVDREFSNIATQVSQGLKDKLQYALRPSREYKGHEIFYSDDTSASKRLNPNPLPTILKTLSRLDPHSSSTTHNRIRNREDDNDSTTKSKDIPLDLAIAYRVYKDLNPEGKLINLGDWWNGFQLAAGNEPGNDVDDRENEEELGGTKRMNVRDQRKKANKRRKTDNAESEENEDEDGASEEEEEDDQDEPARRKQARFLRAVADLAHLGFVHPTTRKPEHVLKSVY